MHARAVRLPCEETLHYSKHRSPQFKPNISPSIANWLHFSSVLPTRCCQIHLGWLVVNDITFGLQKLISIIALLLFYSGAPVVQLYSFKPWNNYLSCFMFRTLSKLDVMKQQRAQIQIEGLCIRGSLPCVCVCVFVDVCQFGLVSLTELYIKKNKKKHPKNMCHSCYQNARNMLAWIPCCDMCYQFVCCMYWHTVI